MVFLNGTVTDGTTALPGVAVTALDPDNRQLANTNSGSDGAFEFSLDKGSQASIQFSAQNFETLRSQVYTLQEDVTGLDIKLRPVSTIESIIDKAFAGLELDLADKAWLAIDVRDEQYKEVDGATIAVLPSPPAGGTLDCDGELTGSSITTASPPCDPARTGPMYLAYFDQASDVEVTLNGDNTRVYQTSTRIGEIAYVEIIQLDNNPKGFLSVQVEAGGRITTEPNVLECNGNTSGTGTTTCETEVAHDTSIRITAFADPGQVFDDWDGCDVETSDGSNPVCIKTITIQQQSFIRAEFDPG